jgi:hypothetical protein
MPSKGNVPLLHPETPTEIIRMATNVHKDRMKDISPDKQEALAEMRDWTVKYLAMNPVVTYPELDALLTRQFPAYARKYTRIINDKRTEFLNLVDWVKAHLTHEGALFLQDVGHGIRIYLPVVGLVHGVPLVESKAARLVVTQLSRRFAIALAEAKKKRWADEKHVAA